MILPLEHTICILFISYLVASQSTFLIIQIAKARTVNNITVTTASPSDIFFTELLTTYSLLFFKLSMRYATTSLCEGGHLSKYSVFNLLANSRVHLPIRILVCLLLNPVSLVEPKIILMGFLEMID